MCVAFIAAVETTEVGLVTGVHMHVLLAVGTVGEASIAVFELALKWLFTLNSKKREN